MSHASTIQCIVYTHIGAATYTHATYLFMKWIYYCNNDCDISSRKVLKNELDARWKTLTGIKKKNKHTERCRHNK